MIRAFLAIELSQELRSAIASFQDDVKRRLQKEVSREARIAWVQPASMHVTIKFLGDMEEQLVAPLRDAVAQAIGNQQTRMVPIERLGAFPRPQGPRVLWVGPSENWARGEEVQRLAGVHRAIVEACERFGFTREAKPFDLHLTLARIKEGERHVGNALARSGMMDRPAVLGSLAVEAVVLMKSDLRPTGPVYTKLWEVKMATR
jgi:2'-5' RNA ligase